MNYAVKTLISCENLAEMLIDRYAFDEIIDDMFWSQDYDSKRLVDKLLDYANDYGYELADYDDWDYETYFRELYECSEKGLS